MPDGSLLCLGIAFTFALVYLALDFKTPKSDKEELPVFDFVFKDISLLLFVIFIFIAISSSMVISSVKTNYLYVVGTLNQTIANTTYIPTPALSGVINGYGWVVYAILLLWLVKFVYDLWDNIFR